MPIAKFKVGGKKPTEVSQNFLLKARRGDEFWGRFGTFIFFQLFLNKIQVPDFF